MPFALTFTTPALLVALLALPAIWLLLRATPPAPVRKAFPGVWHLRRLDSPEETPQKTPWQLLLLRLLIGALVIIGLAGPVRNAPAPSEAAGPLALIIDDGWTAAEGWADRTAAIEAAVAGALQNGRAVILGRTAADPGEGSLFNILSREEATGLAGTLEPQPWTPDRSAMLGEMDALSALLQAEPGGGEILWLTDGLDHGNASAFAAALSERAPARALLPAAGPRALVAAETGPNGLSVTAARAETTEEETVRIRAYDAGGRFLAEADAVFAAEDKTATALVEAPLAVRNAIATLRLETGGSAGATRLLDGAARRPAVVIADAQPSDEQPLLTGAYYVERALQPHADITRAPLADAIAGEANLIVLTDVGLVGGRNADPLVQWVEDGGVLVRFAGPKLAAADGRQRLLPVPLRTGGRAFGGALTWAKPQTLAAFEADSPFADLSVPDDIEIRRQVLAEPSADLSSKSWARLTDGTPLVTAAERGRGLVVLIHVAAEPSWSNLPLSGLFPDMLQRVAALAASGGGTAAARPDAILPPVSVLDGFGAAAAPGPTARPISAAEAKTPAAPGKPPGLYGAPGAETAVNATSADFTLTPLPALGAVRTEAYAAEPPQAFGPWLIAAALALFFLDAIWTLALAGLLKPRLGAAGLMGVVCLLALPDASYAQTDEAGVAATRETRFAYILSGDRRTDDLSEAGLISLSLALARRTALEPGAPAALSPGDPDLLFYPFAYWPVTDRTQAPDDDAAANIRAYLQGGGLILFDTQDADKATPGAPLTREREALQTILERLDLPPLAPLPEDHVLTRSFYLLSDLPGRHTDGEVWVEARETGEAAGLGGGQQNDGVSGVIIGGRDWAGAWARDDFGRPLRPVAPGGERQREMALRGGINMAMYALTGNYKADQVHVPVLLERLGQ